MASVFAVANTRFHQDDPEINKSLRQAAEAHDLAASVKPSVKQDPTPEGELQQSIEMQTRTFLNSLYTLPSVYNNSASSEEIASSKPTTVQLFSAFSNFSVKLPARREGPEIESFCWLRNKVVSKFRREGIIIARGGFLFRNLDGNSIDKSFVEAGDEIYLSIPVLLFVSGFAFKAWPHDYVSILIKRAAVFLQKPHNSSDIVLFLDGQPLDPSARLLNYGIWNKCHLHIGFQHQ